VHDHDMFYIFNNLPVASNFYSLNKVLKGIEKMKYL